MAPRSGGFRSRSSRCNSSNRAAARIDDRLTSKMTPALMRRKAMHDRPCRSRCAHAPTDPRPPGDHARGRRRPDDRRADRSLARQSSVRSDRGAADPRPRHGTRLCRHKGHGHHAVTAVLRAPLLPAAAGAVCIALAVQLAPLAGVGLAIALALAFATLAVASADRARRLCWCAAALVAAISGVATLFGPLPGFDLRHAGPLDGLREALAAPLRHLLPEPEGGIVRGIVLGERAAVDADLASAFARSGTSHLLAISGFNMTLVATAVALLARGRLRPAITAAMTVACVLAYSVLVGLAPSVARAAVMAVVASLRLALCRRPATRKALAPAGATIVGIDP